MTELESVISAKLPMFKNMALRILKNREDAGDAVQDALLGAFKNLGQFRAESELSTWLGTIVRNTCLMRIRKSKQERQIPFDFSVNLDIVTAEVIDPVESLETQRRHQRIKQLVARLPYRLKTSLMLTFEGDKVSEIADKMRVSHGCVKAYCHRARKSVINSYFKMGKS